jgi:hypothetical protein
VVRLRGAVPAAELGPKFKRVRTTQTVSYCYRAYGFGIHSTIQIAGPEPTDECSLDLRLEVEAGPEPEWVKRSTIAPGRIVSHLPAGEGTGDPSFVLTEHGDADGYELSYSDGTRFVVNGTADRVWGTYQAPLTKEDLATYFLGPVMGFLLRRKHITCLHASGVALNGRAVLLCGDAGCGKSTTAAALALRGAAGLSEDIVPLEFIQGRFWAVPGYPRVCLWPDAVANLVGDESALPKLTPVWEKRYLPLDGVRAHFAPEKMPLGLVYIIAPRSAAADAPRVEELPRKDSLLELVKNTYMNWLLDREQRAEEFNVLGNLVQQVPVRRLVPHSDPRKIGPLCKLIECDARSLLVTL